jgi:hypothetical protein
MRADSGQSKRRASSGKPDRGISCSTCGEQASPSVSILACHTHLHLARTIALCDSALAFHKLCALGRFDASWGENAKSGVAVGGKARCFLRDCTVCPCTS